MEPRQDSAVLGPDQPSDLKRTKMEKPELYEFSREGRQSLKLNQGLFIEWKEARNWMV